MRFVLALFVALIMGVAAQAEGPSRLKSLGTLDQTRAWQGVGRVNVGNSGFCTGALIAPDMVLTAAHCFYDKLTGERMQDERIVFHAGLRAGRAAASRTARRTIIHPEYEYNGTDSFKRVSSDLAVIQLSQPIRNPAIRPFNIGSPANKGQPVKVVSYARDRSQAPSLQERCHVLASDPGVYVTSCDVDFGSSGAPVFVVENGVARIMSVVSAKAEWRSQKVAVTAGVETRVAQLIDEVRNSDRRRSFSVSSSTARTVKLGDRSKPSGALFVKP